MSEITTEKDWVEEVLGACFEVSNTLGSGFLEKIYERALSLELRKRGISHSCQQSLTVSYKGTVVGEYQTDIIVGDCLLLELKCTSGITSEHIAQCINYLKATNIRVGLIINFGKPKVEWKRVVYG